MKKTALISTALCLSLMATGCVSSKKTPATENQATTTEVTTEATTDTTVPSEATTGDVKSSEAATGSHKVKVELITLVKSLEGESEYTMVVPKITVDGKEATEINESLSKYIKENYKLEVNEDHADGMSTKIFWGVKDNTLSIIICADETFTDYFTRDVFNYDLDTLKTLEDSEVTKRLGMTDEAFFAKTTEILKKYCEKNPSSYDLDKTLASVKYDKITPFVMPDGTPGVLCPICYSADSQFSGSDSMRCFNMTTMEHEIFG